MGAGTEPAPYSLQGKGELDIEDEAPMVKMPRVSRPRVYGLGN